jgi:hypothetical protein
LLDKADEAMLIEAAKAGDRSVRQLEDRALTKLRTGAISDKTSVES